MSDLKVAPVVSAEDAVDKLMSGASPGQLLVLILDVNPNQPTFARSPQLLLSCLDSALALANSHLMLHPSNRLAALAAHSQGCSFLYPRPDEGGVHELARGQRPGQGHDHLYHHLTQHAVPSDGQFEGFFRVENTMRKKMKSILMKETESGAPVNPDSLLSGALCMALSYINRLSLDAASSGVAHPAVPTSRSRILVISASSDTATQYMNYMNVFFSAQKMSVKIDSCMIEKDSGLLQQGADITGGMYHKVTSKHFKSLLQFLLWIFLPDPDLRSGLSLPSTQRVDYRAACFCHRQLIDIGYVCSVCLSIFCKFSPICTTCHTVFKAPGPLPIMRKKKTTNPGSASAPSSAPSTPKASQ